MLIEFAGIDGAGKTTFVERTMRLFNSSGVPCYQRSFLSTYKRIAADLSVRAGFRHWKDMFRADEIEVAHAFEMINLVSQQLLPLDLDAQVIVTDTYVTKWLATAVLWESDALDRLERIYALLPVPDLSIDLRLALEVAEQRIRERPKGDHVLKIGSNSVLPRYAVAYERARQLVPYRQVAVSTEGSMTDTWDRLREIIIAEVQATGRHTRVLEAAKDPVAL